MNEVFWSFVGWMAVMCISIQFIPQVIKVFYAKDYNNVSVLTYLVAIVGSFLWLLYGMYREDYAIVIANLMVFVCSVMIIYVLARVAIRDRKFIHEYPPTKAEFEQVNVQAENKSKTVVTNDNNPLNEHEMKHLVTAAAMVAKKLDSVVKKKKKGSKKKKSGSKRK